MIVIDMFGSDDDTDENIIKEELKLQKLEDDKKRLVEKQQAWEDYLKKSPRLQIIPVESK
jgi:hypothetical protein